MIVELNHLSIPGGLRLQYAAMRAKEATGTPVLCLHGLTRNHRDFETVMQHAGASGRDAYAINMRGRAGSDADPDPNNYQVPTYAHDVRLFLDDQGLEKVRLIGTSMGGLISMMLANTDPDRIEAILLNDIGPVIEQEGLDRIAGYVGSARSVATWAEAADVARDINGTAFPERLNDKAFWIAFAQRLFKDQGEAIELDYDPAISANVKAGVVAPPAMWDLFEATKAYPLMVVRGALSDLLSAETARAMVMRHGNAELVEVEGVGHAPMLDEPQAQEALLRFLA